MLNRLDAFQMRGLRYILKIEHSYFSRVSNEEIYKRANIALNNGEDLNITWQEFINASKYANPRMITKLSTYVMDRQASLLGHLIRADDADIMKRATLDPNEKLQQITPIRKRVGQPRHKYVDSVCQYICKKRYSVVYDETDEMKDKIIEDARARKF